MIDLFRSRGRHRRRGKSWIVPAVCWLAAGMLLAPSAMAAPRQANAPQATSPAGGDCTALTEHGRAFVFASADPVLRDYGYVIWRQQPSLIAEPLAYDDYAGRRGQLTGRVFQRQGERWIEAVLDDCQRVYAEDASRHSPHAPLKHLELHGRIYFTDTLQAAEALVGQYVQVRAEGLVPRHRLYTPQRDVWYPLEAQQTLRVVGVDTHRYAHAKGVGSFFLAVENAAGQRGLIKFNPQYLRWPDRAIQVAESQEQAALER